MASTGAREREKKRPKSSQISVETTVKVQGKLETRFILFIIFSVIVCMCMFGLMNWPNMTNT